MSAVNRAAVEAVLRQYTDPYMNQDPVSAGCVRAIEVQGERVSVQLELGYAAGLFKSGWAQNSKRCAQYRVPATGNGRRHPYFQGQ